MPTQTAGLSSDVLNAALSGLELQKQKIEEHIQEVRAMLGIRSDGQKRRGRPPKSAASTPAPTPGRTKGKRSAAVRARMAEAQRKRWAAIKAPKEAAAKTAPKKRKLSAAARKKISEATKKRWAAFKAQKAAS
jgi:hypothetical protein